MTNTRVRSSTTSARKLKNQASSSARPLSTSSSPAASDQDSNSRQITEKSLLGPLLSAQFSKLGLHGFKSDPEFNQIVSTLADKVISKGHSADKGKELTENVGQIWDDVLDAVNSNSTSFGARGWSEQFIKQQRASLIKRTRSEVASPYLRFKNGLFDVDKRFLAGSGYTSGE